MVSTLTPVMRTSSPKRRLVFTALTVSVWSLEPVRESSKTYGRQVVVLRSRLEDDAATGEAAAEVAAFGGGSVEIADGVAGQAAHGIRSVGCAGEAVEDGELAGGVDFEDVP